MTVRIRLRRQTLLSREAALAAGCFLMPAALASFTFALCGPSSSVGLPLRRGNWLFLSLVFSVAARWLGSYGAGEAHIAESQS